MRDGNRSALRTTWSRNSRQGPSVSAASVTGDVPDPAVRSSSSATDRIQVIDASALLALLFAESGAEAVADAIADGAVVGAVNLGEVATVLARRGLNPDELLRPLSEQVTVEPFGARDAGQVAYLYGHTAPFGLSCGDRACLALAIRLDKPALTAEQSWASLDIGVEVRVIRDPKSRDP